jgi:hypothetical protein
MNKPPSPEGVVGAPLALTEPDVDPDPLAPLALTEPLTLPVPPPPSMTSTSGRSSPSPLQPAAITAIATMDAASSRLGVIRFIRTLSSSAAG